VASGGLAEVVEDERQEGEGDALGEGAADVGVVEQVGAVKVGDAGDEAGRGAKMRAAQAVGKEAAG
jgi:hypothetical protein